MVERNINVPVRSSPSPSYPVQHKLIPEWRFRGKFRGVCEHRVRNRRNSQNQVGVQSNSASTQSCSSWVPAITHEVKLLDLLQKQPPLAPPTFGSMNIRRMQNVESNNVARFFYTLESVRAWDWLALTNGRWQCAVLQSKPLGNMPVTSSLLRMLLWDSSRGLHGLGKDTWHLRLPEATATQTSN